MKHPDLERRPVLRGMLALGSTRIPALLLYLTALTACAAPGPQAGNGMAPEGKDFSSSDADKDGYLSLDEFKAIGKDDLAFRAADLDGDGRVEPSEYDRYLKALASDQGKPAPP